MSDPFTRRRNAVDDVSRAWLEGLSAAGVRRVHVIADLHALMLRGARQTLASRPLLVDQLRDYDLEKMAHEVAESAVLAVINNLDEYRGESRFTTWAYAFAVRASATVSAREARRPVMAHLDDHGWRQLEGATEDPMSLGTLRRAVQSRLTERQRLVFVATALNGAALDDVAAQVGATRDALYRDLLDARRALAAHLRADD